MGPFEQLRRAPRGLRPGGRSADGARRPVRSARLALLDVDGAAVGAAPRASAVVATASGRARAVGAALSFATGRLPRGLLALREQLHHGGEDVVHDGAAVTAVTAGAAARRAGPLPPGTAERHAGDRSCATDQRAAAHPTAEEVSGPPDATTAALAGEPEPEVEVTVTAVEPGELDAALPAAWLLGLTAGLSIAPVLPGVPIVAPTAPGFMNGAAASWPAGQRELAPADLLAVGEGPHDASLLAAAGTAVVTGRAGERLRRAAHLLAPPVPEEGPAAVPDVLAQGEL